MTVPMTAERARERFDRGVRELARAGEDPAVLASALNAVHGALDAHVRSVLASDPRVPAQVRVIALDANALSFVDAVDAMHAHAALPSSERTRVLEAHRHWEAQGQGDGFGWD